MRSHKVLQILHSSGCVTLHCSGMGSLGKFGTARNVYIRGARSSAKGTIPRSINITPLFPPSKLCCKTSTIPHITAVQL